MLLTVSYIKRQCSLFSHHFLPLPQLNMFSFHRDSALSKHQSNTFKGRLKVFLENITVHCYRNLVDEDRSGWERFLWFIIHLIFGLGSIVIILQSWNGFNEAPLVTKLHNTLYPSSKVPFPGVTICNANRISKRAAVKFAEELKVKYKQKHPEVNRSTEWYLDQILYFASLYSYDYLDENPLLDFQRMLDEVYDSQVFTITTEIMQRLTPRCEEMFMRCFWQSQEFKCVNGPVRMFETRRSGYGFCCSFNYVMRPNFVVDKPRFSTYTGPDMGLVLLIHGQPNDYFAQLQSSKGLLVLIHNPFDFPTVPNGGVNQIQVRLGRETFIRIDATTVTADEFIVNYSPATRRCLFPREMGTKYGGIYARSQCLVYCRMKSVLALCDCVPFNMPIDLFYSDNSTQMQICSLNHVACLNKYRIKWWTVSTEILNTKGLEREREESLLCSDCLASCFDEKYFASSNSLPLRQTKRKGANVMEAVKNVSQTALVRIFFGQPETWQFLQTVQLMWFEIISNFGGIFGILLGFSMLSGTEIIYFIGREIYYWILDKWHDYKLETEDGLVIVP